MYHQNEVLAVVEEILARDVPAETLADAIAAQARALGGTSAD